MTEVWYEIKTQAGSTMIRDYAQAQKCKANGAEVKLVYKSVPDRIAPVDEERRQKLMEYFKNKAQGKSE